MEPPPCGSSIRKGVLFFRRPYVNRHDPAGSSRRVQGGIVSETKVVPEPDDCRHDDGRELSVWAAIRVCHSRSTRRVPDQGREVDHPIESRRVRTRLPTSGEICPPRRHFSARRVALALLIGIRADRPSHTTVHTGPYTAVRFSHASHPLEGLWEVAPGRGRKPTYGPEKIQSIVDATLRSKPKGMTHWSCRLMAEAQQVSKSTVNIIWQSHNLKPHRVKTFKLSRDAKFLEKLTDIVGLYLNHTTAGDRVVRGRKEPDSASSSGGSIQRWKTRTSGELHRKRTGLGKFN